MSTTYEIACVCCKATLWVGQTKRLYTGQAHIEALESFLNAHVGHHLVYATTLYTVTALQRQKTAKKR